jgi:DNA-binding MarR family transcriptional regulator
VEGRVGYELKRAQQAFCVAVDDALRRVGLTNAQYAVLAMLEEAGALSGAELARRLFVTPQTMNQLVASLEARALVGRAAHPFHGRILQTSLTERGRSLLAAAHERVRAIEERMVAGLSEQERHELVRLLGACAHALTPTGSADPAQHQATPILAGGPGTRQERGSPS